MTVVAEEPSAWAEKHFGGLSLGDKRRNRRIIAVGKLMAKNPGASIPAMTSCEYEMKAVYKLFARPEVTPDAIEMTHRRLVRAEASVGDRTVLFFQDLSTISYSGRAAIKGLGPVGDGRADLQGYHMHTVLAARWHGDCREAGSLQRRPAVEVLGLADQQLFVRTPRPEDEGKDEKKKRLRRERESQYWGWATERIGRAGQGCDWVRITDAEGDIHPYLSELLEYDWSFVIRAGQNRALVDSDHRYVFDAARAAASLGQLRVHLRGRGGEPARDVTVQIASCPVTLRAPYRPDQAGDPVSCSVVRVWESDPAEGREPLEWILLTDRNVGNFDGAEQVALMYSSRWLIEEFHKALKSGMGVERLQFETGEALMAAGAAMSLVAVRLLILKENARSIAQESAESSGLSPVELQVLRAKSKYPIATVRDVALAVAALGGHKARKCDGMPGWQTLWKGMLVLTRVVEGVILTQRMRFEI